MSTAILEVRDVVRTFGGLRAVDEASFHVDEGSITALIGPNGAGKSTLFNVVSGFLSAERGTVQFEGRRIDRAPAHRIAQRGLVRTFQVPRALTRMSVLDNVLLAATRHPGERLNGLLLHPGRVRSRERSAHERAAELLALFRLDTHAGEYAGVLSGGQRKLLDFARVLMAEPRLVLLDEPMAGVNPAYRDRDDVPLRRARSRHRHGGERPRDRHERRPCDRQRHSCGGAGRPARRRRVSGNGASDVSKPLLEVADVEAGYGEALVLRGADASYPYGASKDKKSVAFVVSKGELDADGSPAAREPSLPLPAPPSSAGGAAGGALTPASGAIWMMSF